MTDALSASPSDADIDQILTHAVRAPSLLNTQPWRFVVDRGAVAVYADRSRQLPTLDPDGRELTMSCGAALLGLRIAARHAGWEAEAHPFPLPDDPDLLAAVTFRRTEETGDDRLFRALALRYTNRHPFTDEPVPPDLRSALEQAAEVEGASLNGVEDPGERDALAALVESAIVELSTNAEVASEISAWLRAPDDPRPDGVRDADQGIWDRHATMRTPPSAVADYKGRLIREAPVVYVLTTPGDGPADWLAAGQALARALVVAADRGLAASYANEPVEVVPLRERLAALVGGGVPQVVFRVGYPEAQPHTLRRPVRDVTDHAG